MFPQKGLMYETLTNSPSSDKLQLFYSPYSTYIDDEPSLSEHNGLGPVSGDVSVELLTNEGTLLRELTNQCPLFTWPLRYHLTL